MGGKATPRVTCIEETQMRATLIDTVTMLYKLYGELTELISGGLRKSGRILLAAGGWQAFLKHASVSDNHHAWAFHLPGADTR
jgi:hypothetical protein